MRDYDIDNNYDNIYDNYTESESDNNYEEYSAAKMVVRCILLLSPLGIIYALLILVKERHFKYSYVLMLVVSLTISPFGSGVISKDDEGTYKFPFQYGVAGLKKGISFLDFKPKDKEGKDSEDDKPIAIGATAIRPIKKDVPPELEEMYKEYISILTEVAQKKGVKLSQLLTINLAEASPYASTDLLMGNTSISPECYGREIDGVRMTLKTYGSKYFDKCAPLGNWAKEINIPRDRKRFKGPFQMDPLNVKDMKNGNPNAKGDVYNFYDAAYAAADHMIELKGHLKSYSDVTPENAEFLAMAAYNSGGAGVAFKLTPKGINVAADSLKRAIESHKDQISENIGVSGDLFNEGLKQILLGALKEEGWQRYGNARTGVNRKTKEYVGMGKGFDVPGYDGIPKSLDTREHPCHVFDTGIALPPGVTNEPNCPVKTNQAALMDYEMARYVAAYVLGEKSEAIAAGTLGTGR